MAANNSRSSLSSSSEEDNWDSDDDDRRSSRRVHIVRPPDSDDDSLAAYFPEHQGMVPYEIPPPTRARPDESGSSSRALPPPSGKDLRILEPYRETLLVPTGYVTIESPSSQRDYTIHLELDIEEDVDDKIQHLVRLKRLGRFHEAATFFDENLTDHLREKTVMNTYAELLLEQGDYKTFFEAFNVDRVTHTIQMAPQAEFADPMLLDDWHMALLLELARIYSNPELYHSYYTATSILRQLTTKFVGDQEHIDTAKHQVRCRVLTLLGRIHCSTRMLTVHNCYAACDIQKDVGSYRNYLEEGRHWELRDVIYAFFAAFGPIETCRLLFQAHSLEAAVSELVRAWECVLPDEMSDICLLDILVCFCRGYIQVLDNNSDVQDTKSIIFEHARRVATAVKDANPENTKCRPYLHWILAEMAHARAIHSIRETSTAQSVHVGPQCFRRFPGTTYGDNVLPIYVPLLSENPGWPVRQPNTPDSENLLLAVRSAAEELGDFSTQADCLREMICHSPTPSRLMDELEQLQHSVMGDKLGKLQTRLSRFLICNTTESRRQLYQNLLAMNIELRSWSQMAHPIMQWCHRRVMAALLLDVQGFTAEAKTMDAQAAALRSHIPEGFLSEKRWYQYIQKPMVPRQPRDRRSGSRRRSTSYPGRVSIVKPPPGSAPVSTGPPPPPPPPPGGPMPAGIIVPPTYPPKPSSVPANKQTKRPPITISQSVRDAEAEVARRKAKSSMSRAGKTTIEDEEEVVDD